MRTYRFTGWLNWKLCVRVSCTLLVILYCCRHVKGVVEISPSGVAPVCLVGDQLKLTCSTTGMFHRWEVTVMIPQTMTFREIAVFTSIGPSGELPPMMINNSTLTFSRLSGNDSLPLISGMTVNSVTSDLNGAVVNCFEGSMSTDSVATTTIRIIDPGQFDLSLQSRSEQFSSNGVTINLEWIILNSQSYYQRLLSNVSVSANPQLNNVMPTGNMSIQLVLSYNTLYNVSVTQHSTCRQLMWTKVLLLNYSKCSDPMELTNALALDYVDPAREGQNITFTCPTGQILNGSNSSMCMGNGEWEPDPREVACTGTPVITTTLEQTTILCMSQDDCSGRNTTQPNTLGVALGVIFGTILAAIITVAVIVFIIVLKKKRLNSDSNAGHLKHTLNSSIELDTHSDRNSQDYKDEGTLVYADIGQRPAPTKSNINTHLLDDNRVEYALLDHTAQKPKVSTLQESSAANTSDNFPSVNLDNLLIQLGPQVGPKWYQFGEAAGIEKEALDKIAECPPDQCIIELFDHWLRFSTEPPTWRTVADVLKAINLTELGCDIEKVYTTGALPIEVDMNRIPKLDSQEDEPPPPLPARSGNFYIDAPSHTSQAVGLDSQRQKPRVAPPVSNEMSAPALPPKPPRMKSTNT